jgi:hypothetical protein
MGKSRVIFLEFDIYLKASMGKMGIDQKGTPARWCLSDLYRAKDFQLISLIVEFRMILLHENVCSRLAAPMY